MNPDASGDTHDIRTAGEYSAALFRCCQRVSSILLRYYDPLDGAAGGSDVVKEASDPRTVVTKADLEAEQALISILRNDLKCGFLTEEEGAIAGERGTHLRAIIDPLDGSKNFVAGTLGLFGVSIALENQGDLVAGAIALPAFGEIILGERGCGVQLFPSRLGRPIRVAPKTSTTTLSRARINLARGAAPASVLVHSPLSTILGIGNECVNYASSSVGLASVIMGRIDALILASQRYWDFAAGLFLVRELGGCFGVWVNDWAARAATVDLAAATPRSSFGIIACMDAMLFQELESIVSSPHPA